MQYPKSPIVPVVESLHGVDVTDNYRWLEKDNASVAKWTAAQNEIVANTLERTTTHSRYQDEIEQLLAIDVQSAPSVRAGRYFFTAQQADQDQDVLYYQDGLDGEPVALVDPNKITIDSGKSTSLHYYSASPEGRYVSYGLMVEGHEMSSLIVRDIKENKELVSLPFHRSPAQWLPDETGFYHFQFPDPSDVPDGEAFYHVKVYSYSLVAHTDKKVFGDGFHKETSFGCSISPDGGQIIISSSRGWRSNDLYIGDTKTHQFRPLIKGYDATFGAVQLRDSIVISTNYNAPNKRFLAAPYDAMPARIEDWHEIIEESADAVVGWTVTSEYIIVEYLHNVASRVKLFTYDGAFVSDIALPALSSIGSIHANRRESEFFYSFGNFLASQAIYRFNPETMAGELFREPQRSLDQKEYEAKQEWYESKDGTSVPMFIIRKKNLAKSASNKVLLYGYGGFKNSETPGLMLSWLPFIERGGTFVIANIRGGGEFGRTWHEGGVGANKQNGFDDFICAAEYLVDKGYTSPPHLAIMGGSNGGLLVAACMVQRPELFGAVVCRVPLTDMVRFPKFLMASRWTEEYGDPSIKKEFNNILKWSPYHNIKQDVHYPPILIMTGIHDNRVAPLHARKFAAALQATSKTNPVFLYTDTKIGHGGGRGRSHVADNVATILTFLEHSI